MVYVECVYWIVLQILKIIKSILICDKFVKCLPNVQ